MLATKANAEDTPTYAEAMSGPLRQGFMEACRIEIETLMRKECWEVADDSLVVGNHSFERENQYGLYNRVRVNDPLI